MNNSSNDSSSLSSDYTLTLQGNEDRFKTSNKKRHTTSNIQKTHLHYHSSQEEEFWDDLRDSLHLARVRMNKNHFRRNDDQYILMTTSLIENEVIKDPRDKPKKIEVGLQSEPRILDLKLLETYSNKEFIPNRAKAA
jgi:hypothetical protein